MRALLRFLRRRIALKLTLTLVGFVAVTAWPPGLYLNRALEGFAVESLESRLALGRPVSRKRRGACSAARRRSPRRPGFVHCGWRGRAGRG